jgi:DNA-directed RNA polymerase subunit RPC12/RpoP
MEKEKCNLCKGEMELIRTDEIKGTKYDILKCKNCNHQVARHAE